METYEAIFNKDKNKGVFAISLVNKPAMQGTFIALKEDEPIKFAEVDKEQQILIGLVLEPNKKVYRNQGGKEFNMFFCADTIKELSHNFFRSGFHTNSTIEHSKDKPLEGVTFVESWIIENPKIDKSTNFGFNYPKGSWMVSMKIDDPKLWKEYVKTGEVLGFSIDAMVDLQKVNIKTEIKMSEIVAENKSVVDAIVELGKDIKSLFVKKDTKVELGSIKSGDLVIYFDGETMAAGQPVWMENEAGEKMPLPVGDYEIEGDRKLIVKEEGIVGEVQEGAAPAEEIPAPAEMESEAAAPAEAAAPVGEAEAAVNAIKSLLIKYSEEAEAKADAKEKVLLSKIEALEEQVVKFAEAPKADRIISAPLKFEDMTNYQKMQYKRKNG